MDLQTDSGMPYGLKLLIWAALGVAALHSIVKNARDSRLIQFIVSELKTNSGKSVKDILLKTAKDSEDARILSEKLDRSRRRDAKKLRDALSRVGKLEKDFLHFVYHEGRNDLHTSELYKEAEAKIKQQQEQEKGRS